MQDDRGCPVGEAYDGFSAYCPGTLRLLSRYVLSAPALLSVWQSGAVPLLGETTAVVRLPQRPCVYEWTAAWVRLLSG
jgi:hypothetical protein